MKKLALLLIIWTLILVTKKIHGQAGALDPSFSGDGMLTTNIGTGDDFAQCMTIQSDGKIVVGGYTNIVFLNNDFSMARYNTDGSLDNTFGAGGKVISGFGTDEIAYAMAIQADGKIILAGTSNIGQQYNIELVRFNTNGTPDNSFGTNGIVITDLGSAFDGANAIVIQPDGKIVVGGNTYGSRTFSDFALVRYNSTGTIDNAFGNMGIVRTDLAVASSDYLHSLLLQSDGKIIASGVTSGTDLEDFAMVRYNSNGSIDNTFANSGKVITALGKGVDQAFSSALQPDGKIILAGTADNGYNYDFALARFNTDGFLDNTFGAGGRVITPVGAYDKGSSVALQNDGKIVVAGFTTNGSGTDFALVRYNGNGHLDNTFDGDGMLATNFGIANIDEATSVSIQSDGKIVAAGNSMQSNYDYAVARYLGATSLGIAENIKPKINAFYDVVNKELNINGTDEKGEIRIWDVLGKEIAHQSSEQDRTKFYTGEIVAGCYFLRYSSGEGSTELKFVVY